MGKGAGKGSAATVAPALAGLGGGIDGDLMPLKRSHNFCAGPAMLDNDAMLVMWKDFLSWQGSGVSIIEMSQRDIGGPVQNMIQRACDNIRQLLRVPSNYKILLFQGGAHGQFAGVPLNLCGATKRAQYVDGGFWSRRAMSEAGKYVDCSKATSAVEVDGQLKYPEISQWDIDESAAYLHIVSNETIEGIELGDIDVGKAVLVTDMTSTLLSRPVDISKYGVIYASGGKNLGPAGVCVVIVRDDLLDQASDQVPSVLSWKVMDDHSNLYNTQCTFAIWAMQSITDRLIAKGGLEVIEQWVTIRASKLYDAIDASRGFYTNNVHPSCRSRTSIPFRVLGGDATLEAAFTEEAQQAGLHQLSGHHSVGGLRVCVYNGLPDDALESLLAFMSDFQRRHDSR